MPEVEEPFAVRMKPGKTRLVLASTSPRRRELLSRWQVPFEIIASGVPEDPVALTPAALSLRHALDKACVVAAHHAGRRVTVVGADTTIDLDGRSLGKPEDDDHAREMLLELRGRTHAVITSLAVLDCRRERRETASVSTIVAMRDFSEKELQAYVASGEPHGKAGSYAIQGLGSSLILRIEGCFNNVVGLPLCELAGMLERTGFECALPRNPCTTNTGSDCPRMR